ncbi:MAG: hypothetical protein R3F07_16480 [Opitutaceae bacterium]
MIPRNGRPRPLAEAFRGRQRRCFPTALIVAATVSAVAGPNPSGWQALASYDAGAAEVAFSQSSGPEGVLGRAMALLASPEYSPAKVEEAESLLLALVQSGEPTREIPVARYALARISHLFRDNHLKEAEGRYRELIQLHPGHPLAERAVSKVLLIQLGRAAPGAFAVVLMEWTPRVDRFLDPGAVRDFHLTAAKAWLGCDCHPEAFSHFTAALNTGSVRGRARADLLLQVGESGLRSNRKAAAEEAYRRFKAEFPGDPRLALATHRLKNLGKPQ